VIVRRRRKAASTKPRPHLSCHPQDGKTVPQATQLPFPAVALAFHTSLLCVLTTGAVRDGIWRRTKLVTMVSHGHVFAFKTERQRQGKAMTSTARTTLEAQIPAIKNTRHSRPELTAIEASNTRHRSGVFWTVSLQHTVLMLNAHFNRVDGGAGNLLKTVIKIEGSV